MPLTTRLNKILIYARDEAERLQNAEVWPEHLLLAIIRLGEGSAYDLLEASGMDMNEAKQQLDNALFKMRQTNVTAVQRSTQVDRILRVSEGISRE